MPTVFISYSRSDKSFVERLHDALDERGYDVWVDWEDIPPSAEWFDEIRAGVGGADAFVYVISPASVSSEVCSKELADAVQRGKRIVPVVRREPGAAEVPPAAAARNWVFLREGDDFNAGIVQLVAAVETDLEHVHAHTRLGVEADRWQTSGRDGSLLLRGAELSSAEGWLVAAGAKQPPPTLLQREFVLAARHAAVRRQRTIFTAVSFALVVAIALAVVALVQRSTAIHERDTARAQYLDAQAEGLYAKDPELSVLLAVQAAGVAPSVASEQALREALAQSHVRQAFRFPQAVAGDALWSPGGGRLLVTSPGLSARIVRPASRVPPVAIPSAPASAGESGWDAKGDRVVIGRGHAAVYDANTGALIGRVPGSAVESALSSDGTRVATVDLSNTGHVYEVATGRQLASFKPRYRGGATCFAWSPDDSVLAQCDTASLALAATTPSALDTWDPRSGRLLHSVPSSEFIGSVAFSPDSRHYVYTTTSPPAKGGDHAVKTSIASPGTFVYDTRSGAELIAFPQSASAASFSPRSDVLAYATVGDSLGHVYDLTNHVGHALIGQPGRIDTIAFNRAGSYVVTGGVDGSARVYDASNGNFLELLAGHTARIRSASFGLNDKEIATSAEDGSVRLWATPDPRPSVTHPGNDQAATIGFSAGGSEIVEADQRGSGRILSARDLHETTRFTAPAGSGFAGATIDRNGRLVATLDGPRRGGFVYPLAATTYDARSGTQLARISPGAPGGTPMIAALARSGDRLLTAGPSGAADEWDPRNGRHLRALPGTGAVAALGYSDDGSTLALVHLPPLPSAIRPETQLGQVRVDLWQASSGHHLRTITGPRLVPQIPLTTTFSQPTIAFSPDGGRIAVTGVDTDVELYRVATGAPVGRLSLDNRFSDSVAFSPDGRLLAAGTASGAFVWRLTSPLPLPEFQHADSSTYGFITGASGVFVGFTANSKVLLTVGDFALEAWDPADHTQLFKAFAARGNISQDASKLVGTTFNGVALYTCDLCGGLGQLLGVARRNTTRELTRTERQTYLSGG